MDSINWIKNSLRNFGYYPEYTDKKQYLKKLRSYLGKKNADYLLNNIDYIIETSNNAEFEICKLIGDNTELLKIVYSSGIEISALVFNHLLDLLDKIDLEPSQIIDLGGSNGWALKLLDEYYENDSSLILVEQNKNWGVVDSKINVYNLSYNQFSVENEADLIISIFGATLNDFDEILSCVDDNLSNDGFFICCLRLPSSSDFDRFLITAKNYGLEFIPNYLKQIVYHNVNQGCFEKFQLISFNKVKVNPS